MKKFEQPGIYFLNVRKCERKTFKDMTTKSSKEVFDKDGKPVWVLTYQRSYTDKHGLPCTDNPGLNAKFDLPQDLIGKSIAVYVDIDEYSIDGKTLSTFSAVELIGPAENVIIKKKG